MNNFFRYNDFNEVKKLLLNNPMDIFGIHYDPFNKKFVGEVAFEDGTYPESKANSWSGLLKDFRAYQNFNGGTDDKLHKTLEDRYNHVTNSFLTEFGSDVNYNFFKGATSLAGALRLWKVQFQSYLALSAWKIKATDKTQPVTITVRLEGGKTNPGGPAAGFASLNVYSRVNNEATSKVKLVKNTDYTFTIQPSSFDENGEFYFSLSYYSGNVLKYVFPSIEYYWNKFEIGNGEQIKCDL